MLLRLWLLVLLVCVSAFAPSRAEARAAENRTWVFLPTVTETRLETEPQVAGTHQENGLWNYEHAPGCTLAAESGLSRSAVVSAERAEQLLVKYGRTAEQAKDYIASFDGPITARIVSPGESFLRYTDVAGSKGSFLTRTVFGSPAEAVEGLYLRPYGNGASLLQDVTASGRSIILEGGVANGTAQQSLIVNRNAFQFGTGTGF